MKNIFLALFLSANCAFSYAQTPPVTSGLIQHLDAAIGFTAGDPPNTYPIPGYCGGTTTTVPAYANWADQSGFNNHVKTPPIVTWCLCGYFCHPTGISTNANPRYVSNAYITSWRTYPAVRFDYNDFMETIPGASHPIVGSGLSAANGLAASDNITETTLFVVRTQGSPGVQHTGGNDIAHAMVSLSNTELASFPGPGMPGPPGTPAHIRDEFCLLRDWAGHITEANGDLFSVHLSSMTYKDHQCFANTPSDKPVVLSAAFGTNFGDLEYYVNGIQSTNSLQQYPPTWSSINHDPVDRLITIGSRRTNTLNAIAWYGFGKADIFEILVYNRKLSSTEVDEVNHWLKCKYDLQYTGCNAYPADCPRSCWLSPQLNVVYNTMPNALRCSFTATATAVAQPGVTNYAYEWTYPGTAPFIVLSSSSTDIQTFTTPYCTDNVKVRVIGLNAGQTQNLSCCDFTMTQRISCDNIGGGVYGKYTDESMIEEIAQEVSIYPNPTDKIVFVKVPDGKSYTIVLIDFVGKEIKRLMTSEKITSVSFDGQVPGMYMVQVMDQEGRISVNKKVILKP